MQLSEQCLDFFLHPRTIAVKRIHNPTIKRRHGLIQGEDFIHRCGEQLPHFLCVSLRALDTLDSCRFRVRRICFFCHRLLISAAFSSDHPLLRIQYRRGRRRRPRRIEGLRPRCRRKSTVAFVPALPLRISTAPFRASCL